ncbi:MAG: hypothetical protein Q3M30_10930 [Candidatus Electrothrix sp. Rat3]|nr:hypothetical protein [Candidatus Electrothrix rattekaaiensis]
MKRRKNTIQAEAGDRLRICTLGGGGWGTKKKIPFSRLNRRKTLNSPCLDRYFEQ